MLGFVFMIHSMLCGLRPSKATLEGNNRASIISANQSVHIYSIRMIFRTGAIDSRHFEIYSNNTHCWAVELIEGADRNPGHLIHNQIRFLYDLRDYDLSLINNMDKIFTGHQKYITNLAVLMMTHTDKVTCIKSLLFQILTGTLKPLFLELLDQTDSTYLSKSDVYTIICCRIKKKLNFLGVEESCLGQSLFCQVLGQLVSDFISNISDSHFDRSESSFARLRSNILVFFISRIDLTLTQYTPPEIDEIYRFSVSTSSNLFSMQVFHEYMAEIGDEADDSLEDWDDIELAYEISVHPLAMQGFSNLWSIDMSLYQDYRRNHDIICAFCALDIFLRCMLNAYEFFMEYANSDIIVFKIIENPRYFHLLNDLGSLEYGPFLKWLKRKRLLLEEHLDVREYIKEILLQPDETMVTRIYNFLFD